jgi:hypothetical protein
MAVEDACGTIAVVTHVFTATGNLTCLHTENLAFTLVGQAARTESAQAFHAQRSIAAVGSVLSLAFSLGQKVAVVRVIRIQATRASRVAQQVVLATDPRAELVGFFQTLGYDPVILAGAVEVTTQAQATSRGRAEACISLVDAAGQAALSKGAVFEAGLVGAAGTARLTDDILAGQPGGERIAIRLTLPVGGVPANARGRAARPPAVR